VRPALVAALSVFVAAAVGGEPAPGSLVSWPDVQARIHDRWPAVVALDHDPLDDFVSITVANGTSVADAAEAACVTVKPIMHEEGSRALFAIYAESGDIIASWNRCELVQPGGP
jgi:hypothetical protein